MEDPVPTLRPIEEGHFVEPLLTRPQTVCIVALGHSMNDFVREAMSTFRFNNPYDEVWTLNRGIASVPCSKIFAMDDLRYLALRDPAYGGALQRSKTPIVTSTVYPEFPQSVAYPYAEIKEFIGDDVFNVNTVAYMLAYAMFIRVKEVAIYGADFFYPNGSTAEAGGQAVAFLLGLCKFFGIQYKLPHSTTLLYCNKIVQRGTIIERPPYGYHRKEEGVKMLETQKEEKLRKSLVPLYTPPEGM